jgi:DNA modification methylase
VITLSHNQAHIGDALTLLRQLPDESIHCCITSPPYFGLRSYLPADAAEKAMELGAEATPDEYVENMVAVFREVRRALRSDGTCWLSIGDSYAANKGADYYRNSPNGNRDGTADAKARAVRTEPQALPPGLKPKDLCLIPYRVALALQADGWYLRSNIVWAKGVSFCEHYSGSVMPESVRDRPTSAHEAVFLLTKSDRYWYDTGAVRENFANGVEGAKPWGKPATVHERRDGDGFAAGTGEGWEPSAAGRNLRNVFAIPGQQATLRKDLDDATKARVVSELIKRGLL